MKTKPKTPAALENLAQCLLKHAASENAWAAQNAKQCDYRTAADAIIRRGVWLNAALLVQEMIGRPPQPVVSNVPKPRRSKSHDHRI